jgi:hypothetical protein
MNHERALEQPREEIQPNENFRLLDSFFNNFF